MKYRYNSLMIGLVLANSTIFPTTHLDSKLISPSAVNIIARSTCQSGINRVLSQIYAKGVPRKRVGIEIYKGDANTDHFGNPTNRVDTAAITFSFYNKKTGNYDNDSRSLSKIQKILDSPNLMRTWSQIIADNCSNVAVVNVGEYGLDGYISYAIQASGEMKRRQCTEPTSQSLPWHLTICA